MSPKMHKLAPAAGLAVCLPSPPAPLAQAQDKTIELKLAHWVPASHPLHKGFEEWGQSVEKASGGTIKAKIYPSSSSARRSTTTTWRATASPT